MNHEPRLFPDDAAIRRIGDGLLARTLPRPDWTHEAHLAATAWLILERDDIVPERDLPAIIRGYNESVGGVNDDTQGYHETITQVSIRAVRDALARSGGGGLCERVNALLAAAEGRRDWPLRFYSAELLFSRKARLGWVEPDLAPLPRDDILAGYAAEAEALVPAYEALATEAVLAPVLDLLPEAPCRVLDVGAGTGRDAAWLAARGHEVVAVEPVRALREAGMRLHGSSRIAWCDDRLPGLEGLRAGGGRFGLILTVGVWQHLPPAQHEEAIAALAALAAPRGRIAISLRHGPGAPLRPCFPAEVEEVVGRAEAAGLALLRRRDCASIQRANREAGVSWTWLCLERRP